MHNFMICYNNFRLGKQLNIESHYNYHDNKEHFIRRDLKKLHRGWGKHRIEDETHVIFCARLNRIVTYQKGKSKKKYLTK